MMSLNTDLLLAACNHAAEGFALHNENGQFVYVNPAQAHMYGYEPEELMGKSWQILYDEEELTKLQLDYMPKLAASGMWTGEVTGRRKNGTSFDVSLSLRLLSDPESGLVCNCRDISESKATEKKLRQLERLDSLGQLTGGVAHDLNNMLTVLANSLDLASESITDRRVLKYVKTANNAAEWGSSICKRLLAFSGDMELQPSAIDITELLKRVESTLKVTFGEDIQIKIDCAEATWDCLADKGELENAIVNLALNARDAMPDGGNLTIKANNAIGSTSSENQVSIKIIDTGNGIPDDVIDKIFDPFFTTKAKGKGTGLGLSIVYGFAKQTGGNLAVSSEQNVGTEFTLLLPAVIS